MFNYSLRTKLNLLMLVIALMALSVVFVYVANSQANDLVAYGQSQTLGTALERYHSEYQAYPASRRIGAEQITLISENGINKEGNIIYYRPNFTWAKEVTLASTAEDYAIEFKTDNSWPAWGAERGSICRLKNGLKLTCVKLK